MIYQDRPLRLLVIYNTTRVCHSNLARLFTRGLLAIASAIEVRKILAALAVCPAYARFCGMTRTTLAIAMSQAGLLSGARNLQ
jgi:hypothetical protein